MNKTLAAERQKEILDLVSEYGSVKIADLVEKYKVSRETIRRDLNYLDKIGKVKKSHGGATAVIPTSTSSSEIKIISDFDPLKYALCEKAMEFIPDNGTIYLDSGTTLAPLIKLLGEKGGYTIVTACLTTLNSLINTNNTIIFVGGQINPVNYFSEGFQATDFLKNIRVSVAFLGTDGFHQHNGPAAKTYAVAEQKHAVIPNAQETIVVTNSTKASDTALVQFASWNEIDHLITDDGFPEDIYQKISKQTDIVQISKYSR